MGVPKNYQQTVNLSNRVNQEYRYLVSGNYKIIYKVSENIIVINDIFDTRQNTIKMNNETLKNESDIK